MERTLPTPFQKQPPSPAAAPAADVATIETLKRCSAATREAASLFQSTGDPSQVHAIVMGIVECHVGNGRRSLLNGARDELRLQEDLDLDSLTLLEIVLMTEEVFGFSASHSDWRGIRTLGDVRRFVARKIGEPH